MMEKFNPLGLNSVEADFRSKHQLTVGPMVADSS
jgi:hypothetical protein